MNITFMITALAALPLFFGLPLWNLARLREQKHILWLLGPIVLVIAFFGAVQIFAEYPNPSVYIFFYHGAFYLVILLLMLFGVSLMGMITGKIFKLSNQKIFWIIILGTSLYFLGALINGQRLIIKEIVLPAEHITREYRFVQISDLQNSANSTGEVQKIVDKVQEANPEFVVITGDLIDSYFVTNEQMKPFGDIDVPIFLITGNHEYYLESGMINKVIKDTNLLLIDNMNVQFDELDIIGVNELSTVENTLNQLGVDSERFAVLLNHQPQREDVAFAQQSGIDLMLAGHTHGGQIWPIGLILPLLRDPYVNGLYDVNGMPLYVNPGTGTIGPKMRLGTTSEVTVITLIPTRSDLRK